MRAPAIALLVALISTSPAILACDAPATVNFPGSDALAEPARLTAQVDMIRYINEISAYVDCIKEEHETASGKGDATEMARLVELNHSAITELTATRDLYVARVGPIEDLTSLEPLNCVDIRREVSPDIIDNRNVLFQGQDGKIYRNVLNSECRSLRGSGEYLSFPASNVSSRAARAKGLRQCNGFDILIRTGGGDPVAPGCQWGPFFLISGDEADQLRQQEGE